MARRFTNQDNGSVITVFCAEHTEDFIPNSVNSGNAIEPTNEKMKKACKVAYLGWYKKYNDLIFTMEEFESSKNYVLRKDYAFTQQLIWEVLEQSNARFIDDNIQNEYENFKVEIKKKSEEIEQKPSFNNQIIRLEAGEEKIIKDENNILKEYCKIDKEIEGIRINHALGENTLKIKVPEDCNVKQIYLTEEIMKKAGLIKEETKQNNTTIYFEFSRGVQNQIYSLNYNSPVSFSLNLQIIPNGNLEIKKLNKEGKLIDGSVFEITGPENFKKEVTVVNGKIKLQKLKIGKYIIKEKAAALGYLISKNTYNIEIKAGETKTLEVINEQPTGTLIVQKTINLKENIDTSLINTADLSSIEFKLLAKEDIIDKYDSSKIYKKGQEIKKYNLGKNGQIIITNLPMGQYEIQEIKTLDGLILDKTKYEVRFEQKDQETEIYTEKLNISNNTTLVEISKKDITGDMELKGAKLSVLDSSDKLIDEWISGEKTHKIEGLSIGKEYILKEEIAPRGYVIANSIKFTINDNEKIQKVIMKDKIVSISKINIDEIKIEGAKLQVIDMNNKIIDEWISDEKSHMVSGLEENKTYKLHEESVTGSYVRAADIKFNVTKEKENQQIVMIDKLVEITKTDMENEESLEGAELEVTDEKGNVIDKWKSLKQPHQVKGLEEGKIYNLKEIAAPYGYEITEKLKFLVTNNKETQKINIKDKQIFKNIKVIKLDSDTKENIRDKFSFGIYEDSECTKIIEITQSNEAEGSIKFQNLKYGTYYIKETESPTGYLLSNEIIKIEINEKGVYANENILEEKDGFYNLEFFNNKIPKIQTSDESNTFLWMTCLIVSFIIIIRLLKLLQTKNNKRY